MVKLSEDDLKKLYPTAKTYDELQAARIERDEIRRPKFVAVKIGAQTALSIALAVLCYLATAHIIETYIPESGSYQDTGGIMVAVFGMTAIGVFLAVGLYYLYRQASRLIELTFARPELPTVLLLICVIAAGGILTILVRSGTDIIPVATFLVATTFVLASFIVTVSPKQ